MQKIFLGHPETTKIFITQGVGRGTIEDENSFLELYPLKRCLDSEFRGGKSVFSDS